MRVVWAGYDAAGRGHPARLRPGLRGQCPGDAAARRLRGLPAWSLLVAGLLAAAASTGEIASGAGLRLLLTAGVVALPVLVLTCPDGRTHGEIEAIILGLTATAGLLAVAYPAAFGASGATAVAQMVLLAGGLWWRYESATGPAAEAVRGGVLWISLVGGVGLLIVGHLLFLAENDAALLLGAVVTLPFPAAVAVGTIRPDLLDVRAVTARAMVDAVAVVTLIATVVGIAAIVQGLTGRPPAIPTTAVIAAVSALGLQPLRVLLRGVVSRLLFGDRDDPVQAASQVGAGLAVDPVLALRALREALGLPYACLRLGEEEIAHSGTRSTEVHRLDLTVHSQTVGRLDVGLRAGQVRLDPADRAVLQAVAPALAQALHAQALTRQLQDSRAEVLTAVEDERRRLRHDLHDGLGPTLTGIAFAADAAGNTLASDPDRAGALVAGLRADAGGAIAEVRRIVEGLRPPAVDELGLLGALGQHIRQLHGADGTRLDVRLDAPHGEPMLPAAVEVAAYRIVTEALTNVARHSGGNAAVVRIQQAADCLEIEVRDDGPRGTPWLPGVGLISMRERAEQLGGTFSAFGGSGGGVVRAVLPLSV